MAALHVSAPDDTAAAVYLRLLPQQGIWTHLAATFDYDQGLMSVYVDGVLSQQTNTTNSPFLTLPVAAPEEKPELLTLSEAERIQVKLSDVAESDRLFGLLMGVPQADGPDSIDDAVDPHRDENDATRPIGRPWNQRDHALK